MKVGGGGYMGLIFNISCGFEWEREFYDWVSKVYLKVLWYKKYYVYVLLRDILWEILFLENL